MFLFLHTRVTRGPRHYDRASVIENGTGLPGRVSGQRSEGGKRKTAHRHDLYMSPNSIKLMVIKSRNIRLARHETSASNPVSAHKIEHLREKTTRLTSLSEQERIILKCK